MKFIMKKIYDSISITQYMYTETTVFVWFQMMLKAGTFKIYLGNYSFRRKAWSVGYFFFYHMKIHKETMDYRSGSVSQHHYICQHFALGCPSL